MSPRFVHLHLHSEYSLSDSTIRIPELVKRCVHLGLPAVALTDQSNLFALVKFYKECEKAGIKPIAGSDVWVEGEGERPRTAPATSTSRSCSRVPTSRATAATTWPCIRIGCATITAA
jgi:DNA polymerase-3 subunit alpha